MLEFIFEALVKADSHPRSPTDCVQGQTTEKKSCQRPTMGCRAINNNNNNNNRIKVGPMPVISNVSLLNEISSLCSTILAF
jgi:hypothetical protein